MNFGENLVALRERDGISRKDLAAQLEIPYTTLRNYETNQREPGHKLLMQLSSIFSVSVDDLIGNPRNIKTASSLQNEAFEIASKYNSLDTHGKSAVKSILHIECERMKQLQVLAEREPDNIIQMPIPLQPASAGTGELADDETVEHIPVLRNIITTKADYAMRVHGDSMEPNIHDGDLLLVRSQPAVELGETGVFIRDSERYVKVYRGSYLESVNPAYDDVPLEEYSRCIGKVIGVLDPQWIAK